MPTMIRALTLTLCASVLYAEETQSSSLTTTSNPVRKVVVMLEAMHKKITQEGEREKELHDKHVCFCKTFSDVKMRNAVAADKAKIEELTSAIEAAKSRLAQLGSDLAKAKEELASAKATIAEATALREKEGAAFAQTSTQYKTNIAAIEKAIAAIKRGTGAQFLQTSTANYVRLLITKQAIAMDDEDKHQLLAFFSNEEDSPSSEQIVGILSNILDEMKQSLADATTAETEAVSQYEQLMAAKNKEVKTLMVLIEKKTEREGDLSVEWVDMTNDLVDTKESLKENEKLLAEMSKTCASTDDTYQMNQKLRLEELSAISDTIKILNDDDALDIFKKTLPSSSLIQVKVNTIIMQQRALKVLKAARFSSAAVRPRLDFVVLALHGNKIGFEKILKMIDNMVITLGKEQQNDEQKRDYCGAGFDSSSDKKNLLEHSASNTETAIDDAKEDISTLKDDMAALEQGIKDLDQSVKEAGEQRKAEHEQYTQTMSDDAAAKEILRFAKNRLNKFYNPKLYVPPPKRELSEQDRIVENLGGKVFMQVDSQIQAPSEGISSHKSKGKESTGVIQMIDLLISDLDKEMATLEAEEKSAQSDYESTMADSADKRTADSNSLDEKDAAMADLETHLQKYKGELKSTKRELAATLRYSDSLHKECDWLLKYFDVRKEARASEIDALKKAKAILNGADFALIERSRRQSLRRRVV